MTQPETQQPPWILTEEEYWGKDPNGYAQLLNYGQVALAAQRKLVEWMYRRAIQSLDDDDNFVVYNNKIVEPQWWEQLRNDVGAKDA